MAGEFLEFIIGVMRRNSPAIHTRLELRIQNLCSASQNSVYCQSYDGPKSKLICEILLCKLPSANDTYELLILLRKTQRLIANILMISVIKRRVIYYCNRQSALSSRKYPTPISRDHQSNIQFKALFKLGPFFPNRSKRFPPYLAEPVHLLHGT